MTSQNISDHRALKSTDDLQVTRPHQGMPPFDSTGEPLSFFEFWPMWAFYPPIIAYAAWLMLRHRGVLLPTLANPHFPGGGFFGESKAEILDLAVRHIPECVAAFTTVDVPQRGADDLKTMPPDDEFTMLAREALADAAKIGLSLPLVAKPDLGCRGAGVRLVRTEAQVADYIRAFPSGARFLLQKYIGYEGEAGIFYCRKPGAAKGRVISITLKYFPHVYGDGVSTLRELILADPRAGKLSRLYLGRHELRLGWAPKKGEAVRLAFAGSHSRGAIFRNGTSLVTPAMQAKFDEISQRIPEFYFGRFDIRFEDFAAVQAGGDFTIVEINGAGAESTHIWDRRTTLISAWADLMKQYRLLFEIGKANRIRGFKSMTLREFIAAYKREKLLTPLYPTTD